jgi:L-ribulose-5-phosphate 3-epimerase
LKETSELAKRCGIPAIHTHCGFIPEGPGDSLCREVVAAIRDVASHAKANGQTFSDRTKNTY